MTDRNYYYLPPHGMAVNPGTGDKVNKDGSFRPFYGNTVLYELDSMSRTVLKDIQIGLHAELGDLLADELDASQFHMTLHDLLSGTKQEEMEWAVKNLRNRAKAEVEALKGMLRSPIPMRPVKLVSMVSTSIVVLLEPVYPVHEQLLNLAYQRLQNVEFKHYGLTPHITLAYYRPGEMTDGEVQHLAETLEKLTNELLQTCKDIHHNFVLEPAWLYYREFTDMNHYGASLDQC